MSEECCGAIDIVVPVFHEADNIGKLLVELEAKVKSAHRILIIYDFEEDTTLEVVRGFMAYQDNIVLIRNKYGRGVVNALKTGFESIHGIAVVVMADLSDDISQIDGMAEKIRNGYDVVCGSRYAQGGQQIGGPLLKRFLSRMAGLSLHFLTGIPTHDVTNSFKMYTEQVLRGIEPESDGGFEISMEMVIKAYFQGYVVTEIPSQWRGRTAGNSKFRLCRWLTHYLYWYCFALKQRWRCGLRSPASRNHRDPGPENAGVGRCPGRWTSGEIIKEEESCQHWRGHGNKPLLPPEGRPCSSPSEGTFLASLPADPKGLTRRSKYPLHSQGAPVDVTETNA